MIEAIKKGLFLLIVMIFLISCSEKAQESKNTHIFSLINPEYSGIRFENTIKENLETKENVFDFDYFYNGSGVAIVDINNDDLPDILFTANQVDNKLYLNKGDLHFEDITDQSEINESKRWATGVTFADVNRDGWQDFYISQGGPYKSEKRKNLLFINQKDLSFKESADEYGLGDTSISSQSAFFDYDKDGDLDCFVMNESTVYGVGPGQLKAILSDNEKLLHESSSHLYENRNGKFIDVTKSSGLLSASFGLGLSISDIDNDGWPDIYVANDYYIPDAIYINNKEGGFDDQIKSRTNQVSFFGMGVDIADINNDLHQDIFVLDMASSDHYRSKTLMASMNVKAFDYLVKDLSYHYQYMFNSLQLNNGHGNYHNVAQMTGMAKTDWSWAVLLADYDNSGTKDVFITNGYKKYALNNDIRTTVIEAKKEYKGDVPLNVKKEIYDKMPSEELVNPMYRNGGDLTFKKTMEEWGMNQTSFSNGAAYADLDNDGDLDLVVNNINEPAFIYKNLTVDKGLGNYLKVRLNPTQKTLLTKVRVDYEGESQLIEYKRVKGYLSAMDGPLHFGLGGSNKVDTLKVYFSSGDVQYLYDIEANQTIVIDKEKNDVLSTSISLGKHNLFEESEVFDLGIDFIHKENVFDDFELESLLPYKQSTLGPFITKGDVNDDGLDDFYIGGALGQSGELYVQDTKGKFIRATSPAITMDKTYEDMESVFFDVDNDGDDDLFVISGGYEFLVQSEEYQDRLYINDGFGNFQKAVDETLNTNKWSGKTVTVLDYNKDGLKDLMIGNRIVPGQYPKSPGSLLYENTGSSFVDVTSKVIPELTSFGMVNKIVSTDFNLDGFTDVVVAGEWGAIGLFENRNGTFVNVADSLITNTKGWWFTVEETDVNNDNYPDYIIGNLGLNSKYKASMDAPLKVYADDFDDNESWDIVLSNKYKGDYVPFRGRECSSNQMPFIAEEFPTYDLFAKATLEDVYGDKLLQAYQKNANEFRSMLLINKGGNGFELRALPIEAQMFPVLACESIDLDGNGYEDLILTGTIYNTEVETPRLDAGSGLVLMADGKGFYQSIPAGESGLFIQGNIKSITAIKIGLKDYFLFGRNNGSLAAAKLN